jgi:hypothetical protein
MQLRMSAWAKRMYDFEGSLYRETCSACGAASLCWCVNHKGERKLNPHAVRVGRGIPPQADRRRPRPGGVSA